MEQEEKGVFDEQSFGRAVSSLVPVESSTMVRVKDGKWAVVKHVPTGRLLQRAITAGGATYVADIPEVVPQVAGEAETLPGLVEACGKSRKSDAAMNQWEKDWGKSQKLLRSRDEELVARAGTILKARLLAAAEKAAALTAEERYPCSNCTGTGGGEQECWCSSNGIHYLGIVADPGTPIIDEPSGEVVPKSDGKVFDPGCEKCQGTGRSYWTCGGCRGTGVEPKCVNWLVKGPEGNFELSRDIGVWLRGGASVVVRADPINRETTLVVTVKPEKLFADMEMSVADGQPTWRRSGSFFQDWNLDASTSFRLTLTPAGKDSKGNGAYTTSEGPFKYGRRKERGAESPKPKKVPLEEIESILPSGEALLESLQAELGGRSYWNEDEAEVIDEEGVVRGDDGLVTKEVFWAAVKLPLMALIADMEETLKGTNLGLGFGLGFIATGQSGPEVLLTGPGEQRLMELGLDYTWEGAVASAHAKLPNAIKKAKAAGY